VKQPSVLLPSEIELPPLLPKRRFEPELLQSELLVARSHLCKHRRKYKRHLLQLLLRLLRRLLLLFALLFTMTVAEYSTNLLLVRRR